MWRVEREVTPKSLERMRKLVATIDLSSRVLHKVKKVLAQPREVEIWKIVVWGGSVQGSSRDLAGNHQCHLRRLFLISIGP